MFDNSYNRGQPTYFVLGAAKVIKGWEKVFLSGVVSKGQKIRVVLPCEVMN
jgi:FKBP-type peptidyl-prolyl cis-trans isomerase